MEEINPFSLFLKNFGDSEEPKKQKWLKNEMVNDNGLLHFSNICISMNNRVLSFYPETLSADHIAEFFNKL